MNKLILTTLLALSFSSLAAEPFGVKMGEPTSKYPKHMLDGVETSTPPKPHNDFKYYFIYGNESTGVCKIIAISNTIKTSVYGSQLKERYNTFKETLSKKYNKLDKDYEFLLTDSIWDEPKYFMMSLLKKERFHAAAFTDADGTDITLEITAFDRETGVIQLAYEFENFKQCQEDAKKKKNDSL